jgi:glycosidase
MVALLLPGVAVTYYGEEIGMVNTDIPFNETVGERAHTDRGLQRDVVYSWLTNSALVNEPKCGGWGGGLRCTQEPK